MKLALKIFAVVIAIALIGVGIFWTRYRQMAKNVTTQHELVTTVDLNRIPDGCYEGKYAEFLVAVHVRVTVRDHRITDITIIEQSSGPGYEARETIPRILEAQSPRVDAVSGATASSMGIMIAVHRALSSALKTPA